MPIFSVQNHARFVFAALKPRDAVVEFGDLLMRGPPCQFYLAMAAPSLLDLAQDEFVLLRRVTSNREFSLQPVLTLRR